MKHILLLLAFGAGCCLPVQAGINTLLRRFLGEPMQAALVSFAVGTLADLHHGLRHKLVRQAVKTITADAAFGFGGRNGKCGFQRRQAGMKGRVETGHLRHIGVSCLKQADAGQIVRLV